MARGYTKKQTGTKSNYGGKTSRKVLNPWGHNVAKMVRSVAKPRKGSGNAKPRPDSSLWSIKYPKNDPKQWPIEGGKTGPASAMTQEKADKHNAIVNTAFKRAGYAG